MHNVFIYLLNMSITAGYLVIAVVLIRLLFRNTSKNMRCFLWALVGIRLVCPFSFESLFSLIPSTETISPQSPFMGDISGSANAGSPDPHLGFTASDSLSADVSSTAFTQAVINTATVIWLSGMSVMLLYALVSYILLYKKIRVSIKLRDNLWGCDDIDTPFILGIVKPRIYIPSDTDVRQLPYIEAHENSHIRRLDNLWKPFGFILLSVYWFNPLMWLSFILMCRDIELACDERVIRDMSFEEKKNYSEALLMCSITVKKIAVSPVAFGETNVKERVKTVLNYKKPTAWIITVTLILCAVIAVCFLTDPISTKLDSETEAYLHQVILDYSKNDFRSDNNFACEDHIILKADKKGDVTTVYALVMYSEFSCKDGVIYEECGSHIPSVITLDMSGSGYSYEYWVSEDGTRYVPSIREKFPWYLENKAINIHKAAREQSARCIAQAEKYFGVKYVDPYANTTMTTRAYSVD